jgi:hypothetical protein
MSKSQGRGIAGLLDQILSNSGPQPGNLPEKDPSPIHLHDQPGGSVSLQVPRVVARRGRPQGKAAAAAPREKVTVRIATELIANYRDWSWQARSQLSHLVEQALRDYQERNRSRPTGQCSDRANQLI